MRQQRTQRAPAPVSPVSMSRAATELPDSGFALVVDGQVKREFNARDSAVKTARDLKERFPMLQVKVYDAESRLSEKIELAAA